MRKTIIYTAVLILNISQLRSSAASQYLEDFIYDLQQKTENQSETPCVKTVLGLLKSAQNHTLWATWVWDSMSISPVGYMSGTQYQLGNYEQCLSPPWLTTHPRLQTQYCLTHVEPKGSYLAPNQTETDGNINPYGAANTFTHIPRLHLKHQYSIFWGLCLPTSCKTEFIKTFTSVLLRHNNFGDDFSEIAVTVERCHLHGDSEALPLVGYVFMIAFAALVILAVTATYTYKNNMTSNVITEIARAFSMRENFEKLTKSHPEELDALNGVRFISAAMVVVLHQMFLAKIFGPVISTLKFEENLLGPARYFMFIFPMVVDVFFVISGLLSVKSLMSTLDKMQWQYPLKLIIKRYFRLAPLLAVSICLFTVVLGGSVSGPMWFGAGIMLEHCRKNWWLSLLMLNNYVGSDELCYPSSWTVPCDFHMSVLAVALAYLYSKQWHAGIVAFAIVFALSVAAPAATTYAYDLPAMGPISIGPLKYLLSDYTILMYYKSHNRIGPYLVGMILGYVMSVHDPNHRTKTISKSVSIGGTVFSFGLMAAVAALSGLHVEGGYSRAEEIIFSAVHRTVFGAGFALLVICLVYGTVPLLGDFLCWKVFRPLSRLSYAIYLLHFVLMVKRVTSSHVLIDIDNAAQDTLDALGVVVFTTFLSFITWMLVEAPINHMCNFWLKPKLPLTKTETTKSNNFN